MSFQKSPVCGLITNKFIEPLRAAARQAAERAHCPYSSFHVGAAVLCEDGTVVTGCNIENASYGLTVCAERVALFNAISQGRKPIALAVACPDAGDEAKPEYKMPCGACRQVMTEFMSDWATIIVDTVDTFTLKQLLPMPFKL